MVLEQLRSTVAALESEIGNGPIVPSVTPAEIRNHLARYDFANPLPLEEVVTDVEQMMRAWHVQVTHPRYLGLFNPGVTFPAIVADTLVAMYNPQLATWRTSPAANEIERHTLAWLAFKFGFPADSSACFTSGGSEANLSAVTVALTRVSPEYAERGLRHLPAPLSIYLTEDAHLGFNKIARVVGLGRGALRKVAADRDRRMIPADLARQVAADRKSGLAPFMVVATVGTTSAGAIDPLPDLVRFCREEDLWLHVDAAWGGAAIVSPRLRHHLSGIEGADSITCDAHKWFSVPMGSGMFFCRHADTVGEAFGLEASFMPPKTSGPVIDPYTSSMQWSRRFIGLKLFLSIAQYGEAGYARMIEHQADMANLLRELLQLAGWRVVNSTPLPLVCFTRDSLDTAGFLEALNARQIAWMSEVRLGGEAPVLRACITNVRTTESHIHWVVKEMSRLIS